MESVRQLVEFQKNLSNQTDPGPNFDWSNSVDLIGKNAMISLDESTRCDWVFLRGADAKRKKISKENKSNC